MNITQKVFLDLSGDAWESCKGEMFVEGVCACDRYFSGQGKFQSTREWARWRARLFKGLILDEFCRW